MPRLSASEARERFADVLNRVAYGGERLVVHRRGRELAAVIPIEDLARLEALEAAADVVAAEVALAEEGRTPYEEVRKRLGLA